MLTVTDYRQVSMFRNTISGSTCIGHIALVLTYGWCHVQNTSETKKKGKKIIRIKYLRSFGHQLQNYATQANIADEKKVYIAMAYI